MLKRRTLPCGDVVQGRTAQSGCAHTNKMDAKKEGNMEFLQNYFGNEALTYEQLAEKLGQESGVKLANLAEGGYVSVEKYKALLAQQSELKKELEATKQALAQAEQVDVQGLQQELEAYQLQAEQATAQAEERVGKVTYEAALQKQCGGIEFSSESAKSAFMAALQKESLPLEDGVIVGFEEFLGKWKENDPQAFMQKKVVPRFVAPTNPPSNKGGWREKLGLNYENAKQQSFE